MDIEGAKSLAARIRAGVGVGSTIEIVEVDDGLHGIATGDRGVVSEITNGGSIVVAWDRGFTLELDPEALSFRVVAA